MTEIGRSLLGNILQELRKKIKQVRSRNESIGEENTKAILIEPLLSALGWELHELDEVRREYRSKPQDNPVDYALFILRSPRLFVEAKALEKNLADRKWVAQTLSYATVVGVEWCVLTNGNEYQIYNSHAPVAVEEKLFRVIRISDSTQDEYTFDTLDLLSKDKMGENLINVLWKAHFIDRHISTALEDLFRDEDRGLINLIRKKTPGISSSEIRESLRRAKIQVNFPLTESGGGDTEVQTQIEKYTIDQLVKRVAPNIQELFLALRGRILGISDAVWEKIGDRYCDYRTKSTFATVFVHRYKLRISNIETTF